MGTVPVSLSEKGNQKKMKELVQHRDLDIKSYDLGDHFILVEGSLIDRRHRQRVGETLEMPKLVHDMTIRLKIKGPEMHIEKADAVMHQHPHRGCTVVLPWIRKLEGMTVTSGFTMRVKEIIGDTNGCSHLSSLVMTMGPCAVQGYWAAYGTDVSDYQIQEEVIKKMANTCYLWRSDGEIIQKLRENRRS